MEKIDRAAARLRHRHQHQAPPVLAPIARIIRPRTILYSTLIVVVGRLCCGRCRRARSSRSPSTPTAIPSSSASDGGVRNAYTIRILNKHPDARTFGVAVDGPAWARSRWSGGRARPGAPRSMSSAGPDAHRAAVNVEYAAGATSPPLTRHHRPRRRQQGDYDRNCGPATRRRHELRSRPLRLRRARVTGRWCSPCSSASSASSWWSTSS